MHGVKTTRNEGYLLVEETEAHVVVFLLRLLLLLLIFLLLLLLLGGGGACSRRGSRSGGGRSSTGRDVRQQLFRVAALERLGEQTRPEGLHFDIGRLRRIIDLRLITGTLSRAEIFSPVTLTSSSTRMSAAYTQASSSSDIDIAQAAFRRQSARAHDSTAADSVNGPLAALARTSTTLLLYNSLAFVEHTTLVK